MTRGSSLTILMACYSPLMTKTMTSPVVTVLLDGVEPGGTTGVPTQTSMVCTSMVRATPMVLHGSISMPLQEVGSVFAVQT